MRLYTLTLPTLLALLGLAPPPTGGTSPTTPPYSPPTPPTTPVPASNPFATRGMWIWELSRSNGGNVPAIIAKSRANGIQTLMIKSGDGSQMWSQFSSELVAELHAAKLKVCAWQFVYGQKPVAEAEIGAEAVKDGADCLLIDAEGQYEGKYVSAQTYIKKLRQLIGANFPVALAGFPYVDYHPSFPYSVFLGPGGAQYNAPQMYWKDIGTSVSAVYSHTYEYNQIYQRPIYPLGQIYNSPPLAQIRRFRQFGDVYSAQGMSWWDWQEGSAKDFRAVSQAVGVLSDVQPAQTLATLAVKAQGDLVIWAQEHLVSAGQQIAIDGAFGPKTLAAVERFQTAKGLPVTGEVDDATWTALLHYQPAAVTWTIRKHHTVAVTARGGLVTVPRSASLPAKHNEIPPNLGAGRP